MRGNLFTFLVAIAEGFFRGPGQVVNDQLVQQYLDDIMSPWFKQTPETAPLFMYKDLKSRPLLSFYVCLIFRLSSEMPVFKRHQEVSQILPATES